MEEHTVYIYQISGMCKVQVEAPNKEQARTIALDKVINENYGMMFPNVRQIALTFDNDDESKVTTVE